MQTLLALLRFFGFYAVSVTLLAPFLFGNCGIRPEFTVSVSRAAADAREAALIATAEALCPPYEAVAALMASPPPESEACLWYYASFDGIYIPYAITTAAIEYYADVVRDLEAAGANVRAGLEYTARVEKVEFTADAPESAVEAVLMHLRFSYHCGNLCGLWIDKTRTVYFDAQGFILEVVGDGETNVAVS